MSDEERLNRISAIDKDMQDKEAFTQAFLNQADVLSLQRAREQNEEKVIQQLYDVN